MDYDLNWSLADDDVTPGAAAFRNPSLRDLLQHSTSKVDNGKVLRSEAAAASATKFSTDEFPDREVMDIDEFDERFGALKDALVSAPALFVEDAAVGSFREAEVRVRVISDSADYALYLRNLLVRVPLRNAQTTPRPVTIYVGSRAGDGSGDVYTVSDFDVDTLQASVVVSGPAPFADIADQLAHVVGRMYGAEGGVEAVRAKRGGGPRVATAREHGGLWEVPDEHYTALPGADGDALLLRNGSTFVNSSGDVSVVVGAPGAVLAAGAANGSLFAAHASVWGTRGVAALFAGATLPASAVKGDLPAGAVAAGGAATVPVATASNLVGHPKTVVVVEKGGAGGAASSKSAAAASAGGKETKKAAAKAAPKKGKKAAAKDSKSFSSAAAGDAAGALAAALDLSEGDAERLAERLAAHGTSVVTVRGEKELAAYIN